MFPVAIKNEQDDVDDVVYFWRKALAERDQMTRKVEMQTKQLKEALEIVCSLQKITNLNESVLEHLKSVLNHN